MARIEPVANHPSKMAEGRVVVMSNHPVEAQK